MGRRREDVNRDDSEYASLVVGGVRPEVRRRPAPPPLRTSTRGPQEAASERLTININPRSILKRQLSSQHCQRQCFKGSRCGPVFPPVSTRREEVSKPDVLLDEPVSREESIKSLQNTESALTMFLSGTFLVALTVAAVSILFSGKKAPTRERRRETLAYRRKRGRKAPAGRDCVWVFEPIPEGSDEDGSADNSSASEEGEDDYRSDSDAD